LFCVAFCRIVPFVIEQLSRRQPQELVEFHVADFHHIPLNWIWWHRTEYLLRSRHRRYNRSHGILL